MHRSPPDAPAAAPLASAPLSSTPLPTPVTSAPGTTAPVTTGTATTGTATAAPNPSTPVGSAAPAAGSRRDAPAARPTPPAGPGPGAAVGEHSSAQGRAETEALIARLHPTARITDCPSDAAMSNRRLRLGAVVVLDKIELHLRASYRVEPRGVFTVTRVLAGRARMQMDGTEYLARRGDLLAVAVPDRPYTGAFTDLAQSWLSIDPALLDEAAGTLGDREPVRLTGHQPVSRSAADRFNAAVAYVTDTARRLPPGPGTELITGSAARLLATTALATFPNTAITGLTGQDRRDGHESTVRRAVSFIESNADIDIGIADIARAAYVTTRAVQLAFRRHLDTTPLAYLRTVRLDRARAELHDADPVGSVTVAAVAARWGFSATGRFPQHYLAAFGELPSTTLRN